MSADEACTPTFSPVAQEGPSVLLYGWRDCEPHRLLLASITGCVSARWSGAPDGALLEWTAASVTLSPFLAGMRVGLERSTEFRIITNLAESASIAVVAKLDGRPWFLRVDRPGGCTYLLGVSAIPDGDQPVSCATDELRLVSATLPFLLYLRKHCVAHAWVPGEVFANVIVDDPLLRPTYGYLNHLQLEQEAARLEIALTIGFIPWNARRSNPATAEIYRRSRHLSVCVHGCVHDPQEFCTTDGSLLKARAHQALSLMRLHRRLTRVAFEPVMVFPQGKFFSKSFEALASAGCAAVVNTTFLARDQEAVQLRHLLEPAVMAYGMLPLFQRRAPQNADRFRYDAVLGKPLLTVEHHAFFSEGYGELGRLAARLTALCPTLQWRPLGHLVSRVHLSRPFGAEGREIRFYSPHFTLNNGHRGLYRFSKPYTDIDRVERVLVNGQAVEFRAEGQTLVIDVELRGPATVVVEVHRTGRRKRMRLPAGVSLQVAARRYLSEVRDNCCDSSVIVNAALRCGRKLIGR